MGLRALMVGWVLCAAAWARADATRLPVVPDSRSMILRATHIVVVEVIAAPDDGVDAEKRPLTRLGVRVVEVLKGAVDGAQEATARVVHYPPGSPTLARLYGVWSYSDLTAGARFVVFANAPGNALADLLADGTALAVMPPDHADEVELAGAVHALSFAKALARAAKSAATLHEEFADYVLARADVKRDVEALAAFMELPELSYETRGTLVIYAGDWSRGAGAVRDRLAIAMFRILRLEGGDAAKLRDNLIGTWIPNVIDDGDDKRTPAQVFRGFARERRLARAALEAYRGTESAKPLLEWLQ